MSLSLLEERVASKTRYFGPDPGRRVQLPNGQWVHYY